MTPDYLVDDYVQPKSLHDCRKKLDLLVMSFRRDFMGDSPDPIDWGLFQANAPGRYARVLELRAIRYSFLKD